MSVSSRPAPSPPSAPSFMERPVGQIVADDYGRAAVLRRFGIDFCCGGGKALSEACERRGVDPALVVAALSAHDARAAGAVDPVPTDPALLVDHIERVHHAWVRESLPALLHFTSRVAKVHGDGWPHLRTIADHANALAVEMEDHMLDEEENLFPRVRAAAEPGSEPFRLSAEELAHLEEEHEQAGTLIREIRELTGDFTPPETACATWRAAYAKLEEFESDLHRHVHLENNVLFPALRAG
jgi:regulator of cell morphogenesis and NO signaling